MHTDARLGTHRSDPRALFRGEFAETHFTHALQAQIAAGR